jgi:hypothetical protein
MINVSFTPSLRKIIGEVRGNVKAELLGFSDELLRNLRAKTPIAEGRARRGWNKQEKTNKVKIANRVPYIERLENNYSKQTRGRGITKPAIRTTRANRKRRVR